MEIVKPGRYQMGPKWLAQLECRYCQAVFRFPRSEGTLVSDNPEGDYVSVKCPGCKGHNHVSLAKFTIPPEKDDEDKK